MEYLNINTEFILKKARALADGFPALRTQGVNTIIFHDENPSIMLHKKRE